MTMERKWLRVALSNLVLLAVIGTILRFAFVREVSWLKYENFEEAHAHTALFGWMYLAYFALFVNAFVPVKHFRKFNIIFWLTEILVLVIAGHFMVAGYNFNSVILLGLLFCAILIFVLYFLRVVKEPDKVSVILAKTALFFLLLSFLGIVLLIHGMQLSGMKKSLVYYLAIQFFVHVQYNGWFVFAALTLFYRWLEHNTGITRLKYHGLFFFVLVISVFLTFFLSLYWGYKNHPVFLFIAAGGGILQLGVSLLFWLKNREIINRVFKKCPPASRIIFRIVIFCFLVKLVLQSIIIYPFLAELGFNIRNYMIAFLHLTFIGFSSLFVLWWASWKNLLSIYSGTGRIGLILFITGFLLVELLLFVQGTMLWTGLGWIPYYYAIMLVSTLLLPLGALFILLAQVKSPEPEMRKSSFPRPYTGDFEAT